MTDPRKSLTEETPESPQDFSDRQLTEVDGEIKADRQPLTEDLPQEEDEDTGGRRILLD
jgi:hypothetical protein